MKTIITIFSSTKYIVTTSIVVTFLLFLESIVSVRSITDIVLLMIVFIVISKLTKDATTQKPFQEQQKALSDDFLKGGNTYSFGLFQKRIRYGSFAIFALFTISSGFSSESLTEFITVVVQSFFYIYLMTLLFIKIYINKGGKKEGYKRPIQNIRLSHYS